MSIMTTIAKDAVLAAKNGDTEKAFEILRQAIVALDEVARGEMPDDERLIYLDFLRNALTQIVNRESAAEIALGVRPGTIGAPVKDTTDRDLSLFGAVGTLCDSGKSVKDAISAVASKTDWSPALVRTAWQQHGGVAGWKKMREAKR